MAQRALAEQGHFAQQQVALPEQELQVAAIEGLAVRQLAHHLLVLRLHHRHCLASSLFVYIWV